MPDKEFRILIVDDQREVARVLRTSLELLERGYHIVDVPSAEEAILESGPFDLLVVDYRLPGMSGLELIERMRKKNDKLKSVVITGYSVEEMQDKIKALGVQKVFQKPIATEDFTGAVEEALHGSKAGAVRAETLSVKLGDIPVIDEGPVGLIMSAMRADLGADAVVLVDRKGRIVQQHGTIGSDLRMSELAVLLAGNFTTTGEISAYLGEDPPAALHFYDGGNYDIYSLALGLHYFLAVVFPAGSERQMGAVVRFGTRAASELLPMVGGEQIMPRAEKTTEKKAAAGEPEASKAEPGKPEAKTELKKKPEAEPEEEPVEITAPEAIDLEALESALASAKAEEADTFWEKAAQAEGKTTTADKAISLEEAIELGLIPKDLAS